MAVNIVFKIRAILGARNVLRGASGFVSLFGLILEFHLVVPTPGGFEDPKWSVTGTLSFTGA